MADTPLFSIIIPFKLDAMSKKIGTSAAGQGHNRNTEAVSKCDGACHLFSLKLNKSALYDFVHGTTAIDDLDDLDVASEKSPERFFRICHPKIDIFGRKVAPSSREKNNNLWVSVHVKTPFMHRFLTQKRSTVLKLRQRRLWMAMAYLSQNNPSFR